ncbi:MAG TPA: type IX secretion system sortase PorU, partial [Bacteroidales bacterium]|nr:type IX secretion system sortase PorU [Bacteroidales bacterium]
MFPKVIQLLFFFTLMIPQLMHPQSYECYLQWKPAEEAIFFHEPNATGLHFDGCMLDEDTGLPVFFSNFALAGNYRAYEALISHKIFAPLTEEEKQKLPPFFQADSTIVFVEQELSYTRKRPYMNVSLLPFRTNPSSGEIEKLVSFRIDFVGSGNAPLKSSRVYASQSVLATGDWFRIKTSEPGIYKITFQDLSYAGMNIQGVDPARIRLYGNGGAMLPEKNDLPRTDDLQEIAIQVVTASPGGFAPGDYILFYARSPHTWKPVYAAENSRFEFEKNIYSDFAWYFITVADAAGKRIQTIASTNEPATRQVTTFPDYAVYKPDEINLAKTGKQWFGDKIYGNSPPLQLDDFYFPYIDTSQRVLVRSRFAAKDSELSHVKLHVNGHQFSGLPIPRPTSYWYANASQIEATIYSSDPNIRVKVEYLGSGAAAMAWIDYVDINLHRHLTYTDGQFAFRNLLADAENAVSHYHLSGAVGGLILWDVSDFTSPNHVEYSFAGNTIEFRLSASGLSEFIAFTPDASHQILEIEPVSNQNLHGLEAHDMIIVSPEIFMNEAENYAQLRRQSSDLTILVVRLEEIFNEFASGSPDPTAIRDFMKMLYERANGNEPRYLLLIGDGSYDPKDRIADNNNFIPTYQSIESLRLDATFVSDDYFGLLHDGKGHLANGSLDIGIGRFPVNSSAQVNALINKTEHYLRTHEQAPGSWQSTISVVAHDEDFDVHFIQAEEIAGYIDAHHPAFSIDKIYLDAYQRVAIPGGYRYPDVNAAINQRVSEGALLINYIGHGGQTGWAYSRVLTNSDIIAWTNIDNMPVFITATCSFGHFDDPERVSAGELVVLNPNGGGIALLSTSRLAFSTINHNLNKSLTRFFLEPENAEPASLGTAMMKAKNANNNNYFIRNFVLLGDPSLQPAIPAYKIVTTNINGTDVENTPTLSGMSKATISGHIEDRHGNKASGFNGIIYPVVYDKPEVFFTNANHSSSSPKPFSLQNTVLHKGKASVENGDFSFSFIVPRDVKPVIGHGKISYYATNGLLDAHGHSSDFLIGGFNVVSDDDEGPEIEMYINTFDFSFGDLTNENPLLFAHLQDQSGINFFGFGLGRDIVAWLNDDTQNPILLNDYYEPDLDSHSSGRITYPFEGLPEGRHSLRLKAFDMNNNSSEAYTEFVVASRLELSSGNLKNYPNPFSEETFFRFNHNYYNQALSVVID